MQLRMHYVSVNLVQNAVCTCCAYVGKQELMSAVKLREGALNYRTLFVPSSVDSRALNLAENAPYKVSSMFAATSLRSQQVAIITAGGLLGTHTSHSSNLKVH